MAAWASGRRCLQSWSSERLCCIARHARLGRRAGAQVKAAAPRRNQHCCCDPPRPSSPLPRTSCQLWPRLQARADDSNARTRVGSPYRLFDRGRCRVAGGWAGRQGMGAVRRWWGVIATVDSSSGCPGVAERSRRLLWRSSCGQREHGRGHRGRSHEWAIEAGRGGCRPRMWWLGVAVFRGGAVHLAAAFHWRAGVRWMASALARRGEPHTSGSLGRTSSKGA